MRQFISTAFSLYSVNINKIFYYTCAIALAVVFTERFLIIFSYEPQIAGIDNNFDYPVIRSLAGFSIYPNPEDYPYAVNPYAPLFFFVCKWVASLFQISPTDTIAVYWTSRSVCLLTDSVTCILLFRLLYRHFRTDKATAVISVSLFFCIVSFLGYTANRSDAFFLFFYCSTIYVLIRLSESKTIWASLFPAILTTLCIFSKQNGISLLLIVPVWFIAGKNYRSLILYLAFSAFFLISTFLYFECIYTDHFFHRHLIDALKNQIDPQWFYVYIFKAITPSYLTLPLALSLIISIRSIAENNASLLRRLGIICIIQFLFSTALSFKWGSSLGYYNESFLLAFIITALFFTIFPQPIRSAFHNMAIYIYPVVSVLFVHMIAQLYFFYINSPAEAKEKLNEQIQISNYIKSTIGTTNKYAIDLSGADFNFFKNILFKESAAPNIDAVGCCTLPGKIFNYSGLLDGFKNGKIMFIIKEKSSIEQSVWGIDIQHYKADTVFAHYSIYKYTPPLVNKAP
jgi:hypothetical protein